MTPAQSKKTPKRLRQSIRLDAVHPSDFLNYRFTFSCEDCSHFDRGQLKCTLGYATAPHRRDENIKTYLLNGKMALCRFLEID